MTIWADKDTRSHGFLTVIVPAHRQCVVSWLSNVHHCECVVSWLTNMHHRECVLSWLNYVHYRECVVMVEHNDPNIRILLSQICLIGNMTLLLSVHTNNWGLSMCECKMMIQSILEKLNGEQTCVFFIYFCNIRKVHVWNCSRSFSVVLNYINNKYKQDNC